MKSKKAIRKAWVAALRSGKYEQCIGQLRDVDTYCCLGVLCEVVKKKGFIKHYNGRESTLPRNVQQLVGLTTSEGAYNKRGRIDYDLTFANDGDKLSFKQIADIIEKEPEGLFVD